jgi:hypothetical protein
MMMEKGIVEKHPDGEVNAFTSEEQKSERLDAAEASSAEFRNEGNEVSYLSDPEMVKDRLDKIEIELVDNTLKEHQLNAEKEMLTNKLKDLKAQEN